MKDLLSEQQQEKIKKHLLFKLEKINKELEKVRDCSPLLDGWQTSKLAKKSRKYDVLAQEKQAIREVLFNDFNIEI